MKTADPDPPKRAKQLVSIQAARLAAIMAANRVTQPRLAERMGTATTMVNNILRGWKHPGLNWTTRAAAALGIPPGWLDPDWDDQPGTISLFASMDDLECWFAISPAARRLLGTRTYTCEELEIVTQKAHLFGLAVLLRSDFPAFTKREMENNPPALHPMYRKCPLIDHYRPQN